METVPASRNSTEREGEPLVDFVDSFYGSRTRIIARGHEDVLPVNDTPPKLRSADAGKLGITLRKLVDTRVKASAPGPPCCLGARA